MSLTKSNVFHTELHINIEESLLGSRPSTTVDWILPVTLASNFLMCRSEDQIQKYILTYLMANWQ